MQCDAEIRWEIEGESEERGGRWGGGGGGKKEAERIEVKRISQTPDQIDLLVCHFPSSAKFWKIKKKFYKLKIFQKFCKKRQIKSGGEGGGREKSANKFDNIFVNN